MPGTPTRSASAAIPLRRSRGFAPLPVALDAGEDAGVVLAAGAEIKNTVALARDGMAFVSAHVGDLGSLEGLTAHERVSAQLLRFHRSSPELVVADQHPGYSSRAWAKRFAADLGVPLHDVQHHHAHLASLAAEHGRLGDPMLGVVFDGTGYGCDATVWGGEFLLLGDGGLTAERVGHLGDVRLPGGDAGVRNPVRTAALALLSAGIDLDGTPIATELTDAELEFLTLSASSGLGSVDHEQCRSALRCGVCAARDPWSGHLRGTGGYRTGGRRPGAGGPTTTRARHPAVSLPLPIGDGRRTARPSIRRPLLRATGRGAARRC